MKEDSQTLLGKLPQLGAFLERPDILRLRGAYGDGAVKLVAREGIAAARNSILSGKRKAGTDAGTLAAELEKALRRLALPDGRKAVNATGILLHTGLGRAPLCAEAVESLSAFAGYSVLQADLGSGKRSLREEKAERMLVELTGCEAATVVNNNAAATMLVLNTLSEGKEAIISRGQLIEIGGQFRMPDVMEKSRAILREVGTTNRTHLRDYERAIGETTGAVVHVHTSNYTIRGFAGSPGIRELRKMLDRHRHVALFDDIGSGALVPLSRYGIPDEPLVKESLAAGADVVCFSGDKLICGPQCGIICGGKDVIAKIRSNPFARMFRVCKMTLAALESTLLHFLNADYEQTLPFYMMLSKDLKSLGKKADKLAAALKKNKKLSVAVSEDLAYVGSGSVPDEGIKSVSVRLTEKKRSSDGWCDRAAFSLRNGIPSVFCRIQDGALVFDMRTLSDPDFGVLLDILPKTFKN